MPYTTGTVSQFHNSGGGAVKGYLQTLLDYCCGTNYDQNVGTGDGTDKAFTWTITNTPPAKGNILLTFRKGSVWYEVWDDGASWDYHEHVSSSSINYATGACEATIQADDTTSVDVAYCVGQNSGEEGRDWMIMLERNTKNQNDADAFSGQELKEVVIKNSGDSYQENIFVGLREMKYVPGSFYNLNLNIYDTFDPDITVKTWLQNKTRLGTGKDGYSSTYNNWAWLPALALNDDTLPYWFYCSKNRIIAAARPTTGVYTACYAGAGRRFDAPSRYRSPICVIGNISGDSNYSSTGDYNSFPVGIPSSCYAGMMIDHESNYRDSHTNMRFVPKNYYGTGITTIGKTTDDKVLRLPVIIYNFAKDYTCFELEGIFWCPCNALASEDTLTEGGDTYDVFQNVYRTTYLDYMCVKQE